MFVIRARGGGGWPEGIGIADEFGNASRLDLPFFQRVVWRVGGRKCGEGGRGRKGEKTCVVRATS